MITVAANYPLAIMYFANALYSNLVAAIGSLLISLVMLKSVFSRSTAYVGIIASVIALVSSCVCILVPTLSALQLVALIAWGIWSLLYGARLCKLSK